MDRRTETDRRTDPDRPISVRSRSELFVIFGLGPVRSGPVSVGPTKNPTIKPLGPRPRPDRPRPTDFGPVSVLGFDHFRSSVRSGLGRSGPVWVRCSALPWRAIHIIIGTDRAHANLSNCSRSHGGRITTQLGRTAPTPTTPVDHAAMEGDSQYTFSQQSHNTRI